MADAKTSYVLNIGKNEIGAIDLNMYVVTKLSKHIYHTEGAWTTFYKL